MKKIIVLAVVCVLTAVYPAYCQEKEQQSQVETKRLSGSVAQVGFAESFIVVYGELGYTRFQITPETQFTRGTKKIDLSDIRTEDSVMVQYYSSEPGKYVAVTVRASAGMN
ncbi:MAG: hypothetical protein WC695_09170 [Candidatus Omnitrophota bacterium]